MIRKSPKSKKRSIAKNDLRRQLFVSPKAQGFLMFRVMIYCIACSFSTLLACWGANVLAETPSWATWLVPTIAVLVFVLPWILYDAAKASHRVIGPFARVQRAVRQLANGDEVRPLTQRTGDFWYEWLQEFNIMMTRVQTRTGVSRYGPEGDEK